MFWFSTSLCYISLFLGYWNIDDSLAGQLTTITRICSTKNIEWMSSLATNHEFRFQRFSCTDHSPLGKSKHLSFSIYSSEYRGQFSRTPRLLGEAGCNRLWLLKRMLLGLPKVPKQWGRGCPTGASCICAWVPTCKKQLGQFSSKGTYLPGILVWGCHNKRLQFFVLCHHMWFLRDLGKKNSINRLLAPEQ